MPIPQKPGCPPNSAANDHAPDRPGDPVDEHLILDVRTVNGQPAAVDLQVHPEDVEIWHHRRRAAIIDRDLLRGWLTRPEHSLMVGDVLFNRDHNVDVRDRAAISLDNAHDRITISLSDVRSWPLSPGELETLRHHI